MAMQLYVRPLTSSHEVQIEAVHAEQWMRLLSLPHPHAVLCILVEERTYRSDLPQS